MPAKMMSRSAKYGTNQVELAPGQLVVIEFRASLDHEWSLSEAVVHLDSKKLSVGGCYPSPGMVGRVMSKPYRYGTTRYGQKLRAGGCEYDAISKQMVCFLDDGEILYRVEDDGSCYWVAETPPRGAKRIELVEYIANKTPA